MARRKLENRNIRSLQTTAGGRTYIVSLPIEIVRELDWRSGQKLDVQKHGNGILIKGLEPE